MAGEGATRHASLAVLSEQKSAHDDAVKALAWSKTGSLLASSGKDSVIRLWSTDLAVAVSDHDAQRAVERATAGAGGTHRSTARTSRPALPLVAELSGHDGTVRCLAFSSSSPDSSMLVSGGVDASVKLWHVPAAAESHSSASKAAGAARQRRAPPDAPAARFLLSVGGHDAPVFGVAWGGAALVASASGDRTVRTWDIGSGSVIRAFRAHEERVKCVSFATPGAGNLLASGSSDRTLRLFDGRCSERGADGGIAGAGCISTLVGHTNGVVACDWDRAKRPWLLASAAYDGSLRLWDVRMLTGDGDGDGRSPAVGGAARHASAPGTASSASRPSSSCIGELRGHRKWVLSCSFTRRGLLTSGGSDGTVRVWDPTSLECLASEEEHRGLVRACAVEPSRSRIIASTGYDSTIRLLQLNDDEDAEEALEIAAAEDAEFANRLAAFRNAAAAESSSPAGLTARSRFGSVRSRSTTSLDVRRSVSPAPRKHDAPRSEHDPYGGAVYKEIILTDEVALPTDVEPTHRRRPTLEDALAAVSSAEDGVVRSSTQYRERERATHGAASSSAASGVAKVQPNQEAGALPVAGRSSTRVTAAMPHEARHGARVRSSSVRSSSPLRNEVRM